MAILDKLFFLAVRQVSKPVAGVIKTAALSSEGFSAVLASAGQQWHRLRIRVTRASEGKVRLGSISPLSPERAMRDGADLLSEFFIYGVSSVIVVYEFRKAKLKDEAKERKEEAAEIRRREEHRLNELKQWEEFSRLHNSISLLQDEVREGRTTQCLPVPAPCGESPPLSAARVYTLVRTLCRSLP